MVSPDLQPPALPSYWAGPAVENPLIGQIEPATGHGTFIAGLIRQTAPSSRVLAVRVMHNDGFADEADVAFALTALAHRVDRAQRAYNAATTPKEKKEAAKNMVDIVSLSLGFFSDTTLAPGSFLVTVAHILEKLRRLGVLVVAAAGNDSTTRRFYPAALADAPTHCPGAPQVISVGALNPNGTEALFSNAGSWVVNWQLGGAVVSTYPPFNGGGEADFEVNARREGLDPDDFSGGFAEWRGTSFAAPLAAAKLAAAMVRGAKGVPLGAIDTGSTIKRAEWARQELK
jgi:hypothetical protein